jgi:hypothetical protein
VTAAAVAAGGATYVVGDKIYLPNSVVLAVATVSSGAVASVTIINPGRIPIGQSPPANPVAQSSTSGTGTGATFNLTWGISPFMVEAETAEGTSRFAAAEAVEAEEEQEAEVKPHKNSKRKS